MTRRPVNLRVPVELWVRVQAAAGEAGVSVTEFVCERLEEVVGSSDGETPSGDSADVAAAAEADVQDEAGLPAGDVRFSLVPPADEPVIARDLSDPEYAAAPGECPHPPEALRRFGSMVKCGVCGARVS